MSALDLSSRFSAYRHNGDYELLASLGLKTHGHVASGAVDSWIDLGAVEVVEAREEMGGAPPKMIRYPTCTVRVEVACYPAQFWRFTIDDYDEKVIERGDGKWGVHVRARRRVMSTGSGGFSTYWPTAELIARGLISIERTR